MSENLLPTIGLIKSPVSWRVGTVSSTVPTTTPVPLFYECTQATPIFPRKMDDLSLCRLDLPFGKIAMRYVTPRPFSARTNHVMIHRAEMDGRETGKLNCGVTIIRTHSFPFVEVRLFKK
jgi:hypothetical protein